jgi:hypothetical protein
MKKFTIASFSIFAILLLSLTPLTLPIRIESAKAVTLAMQWGHLSPYMENDEDEKDLEEYVCDQIYWMFYYDNVDHHPYHHGSWEPVNAWWTYTTESDVETCMDWQNDPENDVSFVTNWWVGDAYADAESPDPFGHFWFYGHNGDHIEDTAVNDFATSGGIISSKQRFDFIWTCSNGGLYWDDSSGTTWNVTGITVPDQSETKPDYNATNPFEEYGFFYNGDAVGMPLAWTNTSNLNINGYYSYIGDYCYIGFECSSPFMKNDLEGTQVQAYNFALYFYYYLLGYDDDVYPIFEHESIRDRLDYASEQTFGCSFTQSPFYTGYWVYVDVGNEEYNGWWFCRMRVLGDGFMVLPYS